MRELAGKITGFIKKDPILIISGILAAVSCFIVPPDAEYIGYINFRVLAILMSLMLVVAVLLRIGTFDFLTVHKWAYLVAIFVVLVSY